MLPALSRLPISPTGDIMDLRSPSELKLEEWLRSRADIQSDRIQGVMQTLWGLEVASLDDLRALSRDELRARLFAVTAAKVIRALEKNGEDAA